MAWVRIHDGALAHPKIGVLFHWNDPLNVWFWGLLHAQTYQTNGYIAGESVPKRGRRAAAILVGRSLWEVAQSGGWQIHDYLQWNDSREVIQERMQQSRDRLTKWRTKHRTAQVAEQGEETQPGSALETLLKHKHKHKHKDQEKKKTKSGDAPLAAAADVEPDARRSDTGRGSGDYGTTSARVGRLSKERPLFRGERFAIFRWQLDELNGMLGPYAEQFDLHEWFFTLDTEAARETVVISDSWAFVRERTLQEAQSRGLTIAKRNGNTSSSPSNKRIAGLMAGAEACLRAEGGGDEEDR